MCISGTFLLLSPNQTLSSGFVRLWVLFAFISPTSSICTTYIMWYYMYIHIIIKSHYHKILQMCIKIMHQVYIHIYIYMTFYIHIYILYYWSLVVKTKQHSWFSTLTQHHWECLQLLVEDAQTKFVVATMLQRQRIQAPGILKASMKWDHHPKISQTGMGIRQTSRVLKARSK